MAEKNKWVAPTLYLFRLTAAHTQKSVNALINYLTFHLGGDGLQSPHNKHGEYIITACTVVPCSVCYTNAERKRDTK